MSRPPAIGPPTIGTPSTGTDPAARATPGGPGSGPAHRPGIAVAAIYGAIGMVFVGGSVAISSDVSPDRLFTTQAVRYAIAAALLIGCARLTGRSIRLPRGTEWLWLLGVSISGLVVFNIALVFGARHAEPAVLGVAVACVPLLLAVIGPLLERRRPSPTTLLAALMVTVGAAVVQGLGRADAIGIGWAAVVLCCEAGFTLLAIPVLGRHGAWGVSIHATWLAAVGFAVVGLVREGPVAATQLQSRELLALIYLAVAVTAVAFILWYTSVTVLGAGRAGLLTGVAPISAAAVGVLLGGPMPGVAVWIGIGVVTAGLVLGMAGRRPSSRRVGAHGIRPERPGADASEDATTPEQRGRSVTGQPT